MKRFVLFSLVAAAIFVSSLGVEVMAAVPSSPAAASAGQIRIGQILRHRHRYHNRNGNNNGVRYETRIVHKGNKTYRDTYRIEWKNGKEKVKRVSHVRIY